MHQNASHTVWQKFRQRAAVRAHELGHYRLVDAELDRRPLVALTATLPDFDRAPESAPPQPIGCDPWL